jgi:hypothetical protein
LRMPIRVFFRKQTNCGVRPVFAFAAFFPCGATGHIHAPPDPNPCAGPMHTEAVVAEAGQAVMHVLAARMAAFAVKRGKGASKDRPVPLGGVDDHAEADHVEQGSYEGALVNRNGPMSAAEYHEEIRKTKQWLTRSNRHKFLDEEAADGFAPIEGWLAAQLGRRTAKAVLLAQMFCPFFSSAVERDERMRTNFMCGPSDDDVRKFMRTVDSCKVLLDFRVTSRWNKVALCMFRSLLLQLGRHPVLAVTTFREASEDSDRTCLLLHVLRAYLGYLPLAIAPFKPGGVDRLPDPDVVNSCLSCCLILVNQVLDKQFVDSYFVPFLLALIHAASWMSRKRPTTCEDYPIEFYACVAAAGMDALVCTSIPSKFRHPFASKVSPEASKRLLEFMCRSVVPSWITMMASASGSGPPVAMFSSMLNVVRRGLVLRDNAEIAKAAGSAAMEQDEFLWGAYIVVAEIVVICTTVADRGSWGRGLTNGEMLLLRLLRSSGWSVDGPWRGLLSARRDHNRDPEIRQAIQVGLGVFGAVMGLRCRAWSAGCDPKHGCVCHAVLHGLLFFLASYSGRRGPVWTTHATAVPPLSMHAHALESVMAALLGWLESGCACPRVLEDANCITMVTHCLIRAINPVMPYSGPNKATIACTKDVSTGLLAVFLGTYQGVMVHLARAQCVESGWACVSVAQYTPGHVLATTRAVETALTGCTEFRFPLPWPSRPQSTLVVPEWAVYNAELASGMAALLADAVSRRDVCPAAFASWCTSLRAAVLAVPTDAYTVAAMGSSLLVGACGALKALVTDFAAELKAFNGAVLDLCKRALSKVAAALGTVLEVCCVSFPLAVVRLEGGPCLDELHSALADVQHRKPDAWALLIDGAQTALGSVVWAVDAHGEGAEQLRIAMGVGRQLALLGAFYGHTTFAAVASMKRYLETDGARHSVTGTLCLLRAMDAMRDRAVAAVSAKYFLLQAVTASGALPVGYQDGKACSFCGTSHGPRRKDCQFFAASPSAVPSEMPAGRCPVCDGKHPFGRDHCSLFSAVSATQAKYGPGGEFVSQDSRFMADSALEHSRCALYLHQVPDGLLVAPFVGYRLCLDSGHVGGTVKLEAAGSVIGGACSSAEAFGRDLRLARAQLHLQVTTVHVEVILRMLGTVFRSMAGCSVVVAECVRVARVWASALCGKAPSVGTAKYSASKAAVLNLLSLDYDLFLETYAMGIVSGAGGLLVDVHCGLHDLHDGVQGPTPVCALCAAPYSCPSLPALQAPSALLTAAQRVCPKELWAEGVAQPVASRQKQKKSGKK